ncbi:UDP-glucose--hexose-1-phosphate uridylyltransferase [Thalassobacillus pellis]|uniref:UDP-glucose--hexose-1-phosphate uridylyltransferase n=1 Tax=Thalassobacillus pellis TaxID=748008 RepID=UPI00195FD72F|nr:UDP-glucose--hexose-1-phosphate uridylyltransferase [Thalassobacillus pellis]MBM7551457.1 UDPglucose--hexose-1-phosphate uridylyltransferase [Thalassobacillus pellis]
MNVDIYREIDRLIRYGLQKEMISVWDTDYIRNGLLELFQLHDFQPALTPEERLETPIDILENMLDYAAAKGILPENTVTERDLFDPRIMDKLLPRPSEVNKTFYHYYQTEGPVAATEFFYELAKSAHYIRTDRIAKNVHWYSPTIYGDLEITINLSKPEKDPKAIAAAKANTSVSYPKCLLCKENVGYAGRLDHPARQNHRIIPMELEEERWYLQYSPYVYYNEHAIVLSREHRPMEISKEGFDRLLHFVEQLPHYFVGSNADLPIVGGSILSHDHFQAGHHDFPMAKAPIEETVTIKGFENIKAGIVKWPMSVIRLQGENRGQVSELAGRILEKWRGYSDESVGILAETKGNAHNTITPIARRRGKLYELDLVLRNNRTSEEYPLGIYHPHQEVHHIKKENIGLIEVMGLAVLPGRLVEEIDALSSYMLAGDLDTAGKEDERTVKHVDWAKRIVEEHPDLKEDNIRQVLQQEIGKTFSTVLEHAGVFKRNTEGQDAFRRFLDRM